uniref:Retrotransposon gag domain-containing protein n=1 Tax=Cajanus cajan TaxID=3821 RepID=A0A151TIR5_CAJCA|nr:hypothetical protein KK1_013252 [Cajanus cajan]
METPLPHGWKPLHFDRYDGTTDPDEHIDMYTTQINLYTNNDAILCRVFPTSLKGVALNWYTQLPPESIDSFGTLVWRFTAQYATSRPHHVTSAALASLRQNDDEPLRTFMERFAATSIKISLCRESPRDMDELRARASCRLHSDGGTLRLP